MHIKLKIHDFYGEKLCAHDILENMLEGALHSSFSF